jgi:hypothetical protein
MPENNPFNNLTSTEKPASALSARDKLFADMGLKPQVTEEYPDIFADDPVGIDFDMDSEIEELTSAKAEPKAEESFMTKAEATTEPAEEVVDAIFTSTSAEEQSDELIFEDTELEPTVATVEPVTPIVLPKAQATIAGEAISNSALKSMDRAGLDNLVNAYTGLQQQFAANQTLIHAERESIASLRTQMRQLNALNNEVAENNSGLDQSRQLVQTDSCANLIRTLNQVNESIQQDGQRAAQLISPLKAGVEVLELRVKHVNAIENLLKHMQTGMTLEKQLAGADALIHDLAKHLGLQLN